MRAIEFLTESNNEYITLNQLYKNDFPGRGEIFWDYVSTSDLNREVPIETIPPAKLQIILMSQYRAEHVDEIKDLLDSDQKKTIRYYRKEPNLSNHIIVMADNRIIDGNHRALAALLNKQSIKAIDLDHRNSEN